MNETIKRAISGIVYISVMWIGTIYSEMTFSILFTCLAIVSFYEMWQLRLGKNKTLAFLYILIPFILVQIFARTYNNDPDQTFDTSIILFIFILTWTFDTFAYIFGVKFGKNKIMPSISPKKSWEGFAGGLLFTIIAGYLTYSFFRFNSINHPIGIAIVIPFTATLGDFIESYFKRKAGVKDSGNLIPGHGGVLDRMDAFMITIPIVYILTKIL